MAQITEEEKTIRRIEKRFNKGIVQYGLIEEGDKVLVGLSGGKDSLALVELLGKRSRIFKPRFSVVAVHVVMKNIPYQSDLDYLRAHAESMEFRWLFMKPHLILLLIPANLLAFFVRGIGEKPCLQLPKNRGAIRLLSDITWTIFWKHY